MKFRTSVSVAALLGGCAAPAFAVDFGNGLSLVGGVELEYIAADGDDIASGWGDATLAWRSQGGGAISYGFDLTLATFENFDDNQGETAVWGGLVLGTAFGEFSIGNPRPFVETMLDIPAIGDIRLYDLESSFFTGSTVELLGYSDVADLYGVSFKGTAGALTYAASYHAINGEGSAENFDAVELVASYELGKAVIRGGIEQLNSGSTDIDKILLGASYVEERWSAGIMLVDASLGGNDLNGTVLFGDFAVTDAFTLGAQAQTLEIGPNRQTVYGLTGEYGFGPGGFAQLGAVGSEGIDTNYSASIGYRF